MSTNKLINCWQEADCVCMKYSTPSGEVKIGKQPFKNYFYTDNIDAIKKMGFDVEEEGQYLKIYSEMPYEAGQTLQGMGFKVYESDLHLKKRWYISKDFEVDTNQKKLYFDIETDDSFKLIEVGKHRILSFAAIDSDGRTYTYVLEYFSDHSEQILLRSIVELFSRYDIVLGWNSKNFDFPYIKERCVKFNFSKKFMAKMYIPAHFDLMVQTKRVYKYQYLKKFSLDYVANRYLKKNKIKINKKIIDLYNTDQKTLVEYNLNDAILCKEIDEHLKLSSLMIEECRWCKIPPSDFGIYSLLDSIILRKAHAKGMKLGSAIHLHTEQFVPYTGAYVIEPKTGYYQNVTVFDFKSLYPTIIQTLNVGNETLRLEKEDNVITNPGTLTIPRGTSTMPIPTYFVKEESLLKSTIDELIDNRKQYKKMKEDILAQPHYDKLEYEKVYSWEIIAKELVNSIYGITGLQYGRYYSQDIAESITVMGHWLIQFAEMFFATEGYKVIYGDTDSIFISGNIDHEKVLKKFHESLAIALKHYGVDKTTIELQFDKQYSHFLLIAKKTYAGRMLNRGGIVSDEIYARGLDYLKKNTFGFAGDKQQKLVEYIFTNPTTDELKAYCNSIREEFYAKEFTKDELIIHGTVNKREYKMKPLHAQLNDNPYDNDVDYIVTHLSGRMHGVLAKHYTGNYSKKYYWNKKTRPLLDRILECINPSVDYFSQQLELFT